MRVADQRDAEAVASRHSSAVRRREHVLPDRVARRRRGRGRPPRRRPAARGAAGTRASPGEITSWVHWAASAAPREKSVEREHVRRTARSWLPARQTAQLASRERARRRRARRRSRRGRRGTTAPRRRRPRPRRSRPRRRGGCRGCRRRWRRAWRRYESHSVRSPLRLPIALVAALVVAEAAVLLLRPRDRGPEPVARASREPTSARPSSSGRGRSARASCGSSAAAMAVERRPAGARRPPPAARACGPSAARCSPAPRRPPALSVALAVARAAAARGRARAGEGRRAGHPGLGAAARGDVAARQAIGAVLAGAGGALLVVGMRRFGRALVGAGRRPWSSASAWSSTYAGPVVLDPLFNRFTPLPAGELRTRRARSSRARPASTSARSTRSTPGAARRPPTPTSRGLGQTKRVVLYDNLLRGLHAAPRSRLVVAHELGHVHYRDVPRGLLWLALVAPFGMLGGRRC